MEHQEVKRRLTECKSHDERSRVVELAINAGMDLDEIREYLDWLDLTLTQADSRSQPPQCRKKD